MQTFLNLADFQKKVHVLGPGTRFVIWVQGCLKKCPQCINPDMQSLEENKIIAIEEIKREIERVKDEIEGITLLGGEPMLQAAQLGEIAKFSQELGLSVLCYTGYSLEELQAFKNKNIDQLLRNIDVLIDGEYRSEEKIFSGYKGSENQRTIFFTGKYNEKDFQVENSYQIKIEKNKIKLLGFYI